jgi:methionine sulfoxide reductase catalytic subunit
MNRIPYSEITPEPLYINRRQFIAAAGALAASTILTACGVQPPTPTPAPTKAPSAPSGGSLPQASQKADELGNALTPYEVVTSYNNYYEFSLSKSGVASAATNLTTSPWTVQVSGQVNRPRAFSLEDLFKFEQKEYVYRMRCVETWSMVIPWIGFPLSRLLAEVEPLPKAKYVRFETKLDRDQMPGTRDATFPWPYVEGLRLDEAMHDLTILATGLYGKPLPPQDGAPVRLVVPWKYGFKNCKSIVKIDLVEEMPVSFWMTSGPDEYGFYANVNPAVPHPRWSQATERRLGESARRDTLMFNGYADQVESLYRGMDLRKNF